jgi:hypothetical protein
MFRLSNRKSRRLLGPAGDCGITICGPLTLKFSLQERNQQPIFQSHGLWVFMLAAVYNFFLWCVRMAGDTGILMQGLMIIGRCFTSRAMPSPAPCLFCCSYFLDRVSHFCPRPASDHSLPMASSLPPHCKPPHWVPHKVMFRIYYIFWVVW